MTHHQSTPRRHHAGWPARILAAGCVLALLLWAPAAQALSIKLGGPGLYFPKGYDAAKSNAVLHVLQDKQFKFLGGLYSHWPPDWSTTLVYDGDAKKLTAFLDALREVKAVAVRVTLSRDLSKETGSALEAGAWWVKYSQATPDVLTARINLAAFSKGLDELEFWLSPPAARSPATAARDREAGAARLNVRGPLSRAARSNTVAALGERRPFAAFGVPFGGHRPPLQRPTDFLRGILSLSAGESDQRSAATVELLPTMRSHLIASQSAEEFSKP